MDILEVLAEYLCVCNNRNDAIVLANIIAGVPKTIIPLQTSDRIVAAIHRPHVSDTDNLDQYQCCYYRAMPTPDILWRCGGNYRIVGFHWTSYGDVIVDHVETSSWNKKKIIANVTEMLRNCNTHFQDDRPKKWDWVFLTKCGKTIFYRNRR